MSVSRRITSAFSGTTVLALWLAAAVFFEFPLAEAGSGWSAVPQNFLYGFMLVPEVLVTAVGKILL